MFDPETGDPLTVTLAFTFGSDESVGPCQNSKDSVNGPPIPETVMMPVPTSRNPRAAVTKLVLKTVSAKVMLFARADVEKANGNPNMRNNPWYWILILS